MNQSEPSVAVSQPHPRLPSKTVIYAMLTTTAVLWGSAFAASKVVVEAVPPSVAALIRFGLGAVVLLLMMTVTGKQPIPKSHRGTLALLGLIGVTVYNLLFFLGLAFSRPSDGTMIVPTMSPTITAVLAAIWLKESLHQRQRIGVALAVLGAAIFFAAAGMTDMDTGRLTGDLLFLGSAACWSLYTLAGKRVLQSVDPFQATTFAMLVGAAGIGLVAAPQLPQVAWSELSASFWLTQLYLGVFPTALANFFFYYGVQHIGPARTSSFMYLVPISGLLGAWVIFGEWLTLLQGAGSVLLLAGVWLINKRQAAANSHQTD